MSDAESPEIIVTADGSHSLFNKSLNETYHSVHGALQESRYVFIRQGFDFLLLQHPSRIDILEVGFGTGLNALLTAHEAEKQNIHVRYVSLDTYPLPGQTWQQLNYGTQVGDEKLFEDLHRAPWNTPMLIRPFFELHKIHTAIQDTTFVTDAFSLVFFDAFAPSRQPEMWELPVLTKVAEALASGGVFVTYCAQGQLKRHLKTLGLHVETLDGPPGKKQMVRATRS